MVDRGGIPLATLLKGANRHESVIFEHLPDAVPSVKQANGRRRSRPATLHADKAHDLPRWRQALAHRHIRIRAARQGVASGKRLGRHRRVVGRTFV